MGEKISKNRPLASRSRTTYSDFARECAGTGGTHLMAAWETNDGTRVVEQVTGLASFDKIVEGAYTNLTFHASRTGSTNPDDYTWVQ